MNYIDYINKINTLYKRLDNINDVNQIKTILKQEIRYFINQGLSKQEIIELFSTELLTEQQSIDAMTDNHNDYVDMIKAILGE